MKKLIKKLSSFLLGLTLVFALFGCNNPNNGGENPGGEPEDPVDENYISLEDYKAYLKAELKSSLNSIGDSLASSVEAAVQAEFNKGVNAVNAAETHKEAKEAKEAAKVAMAEQIPLADGIFSFAGLSIAEKTEILGALEAYAVRTGITGVSLFENGGYVMYHPDVVLGSENYIVGYGFGVLAEGNIKADLATENNAAWKKYYHTLNASDPGTINYWNDQGSEVGDFYGYIGASYFTTFMNANKDGYDWVPELAKEKPIAVNDDNGDGAASIWKFPVKTGKDGLKYNTNSTLRAAYNNREVELEDYLTPFKLLLNAQNGLYRGGELASNTSANGIKGAANYYEKTKTATADFAEVGLKVYTDAEGVEWFEVEFVGELTQFYAMYYISSSLYMPVPQAFIDEVGLENYLGYNNDKTSTPVDNSLSLGAYTLEQWDTGDQVVYKKNPNYVYADTKYAIPGVHINILTALSSDPEAGINQFLAGNTHSTGIPQTRLQEFKSDPRTKTTKGDSVFKLNVNATDAETWDELFGENGVVTQTPDDEKWEVEPALGNANFVKGLSLAINRFEFAAARGSIGTVDYLSSNYMSDPEGGISYSATQAHKDAVAGLLEDTDGYGYNLELAREYFQMALVELEAEGKYTPGTKESPRVITLEIAWQYPQHETNYHNEIAQYLKDAFNDESVSQGKYQLEVEFWVGSSWSDVYYNKMMLGQFDIGFGSISGDPLNPLAFLNVLSSDQTISNGFTLNWGVNTNDPTADVLVFNGMRWSFDALWTAANGVAVVDEGALQNSVTGELVSNTPNADGSYTAVYEISLALPELTEVKNVETVLCWYEGGNDGYKEVEVPAEVVTKDGKVIITMTVSAELVAEYPGAIGYDIYFDLQLGEYTASGQYLGAEAEFPGAE